MKFMVTFLLFVNSAAFAGNSDIGSGNGPSACKSSLIEGISLQCVNSKAEAVCVSFGRHTSMNVNAIEVETKDSTIVMVHDPAPSYTLGCLLSGLGGCIDRKVQIKSDKVQANLYSAPSVAGNSTYELSFKLDLKSGAGTLSQKQSGHGRTDTSELVFGRCHK